MDDYIDGVGNWPFDADDWNDFVNSSWYIGADDMPYLPDTEELVDRYIAKTIKARIIKLYGNKPKVEKVNNYRKYAITLTTNMHCIDKLYDVAMSIVKSKTFGIVNYRFVYELQPNSGFPHIHLYAETTKPVNKSQLQPFGKKTGFIDVKPLKSPIDVIKWQQYLDKESSNKDLINYLNQQNIILNTNIVREYSNADT